jgi:hypothetical protein
MLVKIKKEYVIGKEPAAINGGFLIELNCKFDVSVVQFS